MALRLNDDLILWCVAVLQPATANDVSLAMRAFFPELNAVPSRNDVLISINSLDAAGHVLCVHETAGMYAVTAKANHRLSRALRVARDSARLYLLPRQSSSRFPRSGESNQELGGVSPSNDERTDVKEAARPITSARQPRVAQLPGRSYRPRIIQQLDLPVGSEIDSPDISLRYGSFATLRQVHLAASESSDAPDLSINELALCIGITPALLRSIMLNKNRHYRRFEIPKRSGGVREIQAPRVFLKCIQRWLLDHLLIWLPVHASCHAYVPERSIITNAMPHVGKRYMAGLDIEDFFGSIRKHTVAQVARRAGLGPELSWTVATLCTLRDKLPQGAPTSPQISNSVLLDLDSAVSEFSAERNVSYTRYADDMTLSGDDRTAVTEVIAFVTRGLGDIGLRLRHDKTRLISKQGQQRVTGIVVNEKGYPPRYFRKRVRAQFHRARQVGRIGRSNYNRLRGLVSFLSQFRELRESAELESYRQTLAAILVVNDEPD